MARDLDMRDNGHDKQVKRWKQDVPKSIDACAYEPIWQQSYERPDDGAICSWDGNFTYAELTKLSDQLASYLVTVLQVGPETLVPVCFYKSKWFIVAILGVMKAGGAFVPLSPFDPSKRLQTIIQDLDARFVFASPEASSLLQGVVDQIVVFPSEEALATIHSDTRSLVKPDNIAYVLYTSGSTGKPKGVVIEHRALRTSIEYLGKAFGYSHDTRTLQFAAYTFDVAILDILFTLSYGGCVCIPSEDERAKITEVANRMNANLAVLTPSVTRTLNPDDLKSLETLIIGGDAVAQRDVGQWAGKLRLVNGYGPTETTIVVVCNDIQDEDSPADIIGRPVACSTWVVDPDNHEKLMPLGAEGELVIQGPILARGYLNDPEKTDLAFVYPKWLAENKSRRNQRVYKTGDIVRCNEDGALVYVGRKDTQVKLHGQRVELGEIENHLWSHALVGNALVLLADIHPRVPGLVAVVTLQGKSHFNTDASKLRLVDINQGLNGSSVKKIRDYLSARLPAHMLPTVWLVVDEIPLLTSGKINRKSVVQWIADMGSSVSSHNALYSKHQDSQHARSPMEIQIQRVIAQVLDLHTDQIQMFQSFSSLGGDSIAAMAVQSRCRDLGIKIRYQDIVKCGSVTDIAQIASLESPMVDAAVRDHEEVFNLSPVQHMYFEQPKLPTRFHSSVYLRITEDVGASLVASAIEGIVRRHSMLRARFSQGVNGWRQSISGHMTRSYSFNAHEIEDKNRIREVVSATHGMINIVHGPVFAADIFNAKSSAKTLFLVAHHLVVDLVSWQNILHDLKILLHSRPLPSQSPFSFSKWCELQAQQIEKLTPRKVFPIDIPPAYLEYWGGIPSNDFKDALEEHFELNTQQTSNFLRHCNTVLHAKLVDVFVAAAAYTFSQIFADRTPPTFHCENHGREAWNEDIDISGTVGWFNTLVPLNIPKEWTESFTKAVEGTRATREQIPGNGQPYFAYRCLHPDGQDAFHEHSNMEVFFNYTGYQRQGSDSGLLQHIIREGGEELSDIGLDMGRLALIDVLVDVDGGCLKYTFLFNRYMHYQEKLQRWVSECQRVILDLVGNASCCASE